MRVDSALRRLCQLQATDPGHEMQPVQTRAGKYVHNIFHQVHASLHCLDRCSRQRRAEAGIPDHANPHITYITTHGARYQA